MACKHREEGTCYKLHEIPQAVAVAKEKYLKDKEKRFLYFCNLLECYGMKDNIHIGKSTRPRGKSGPWLNQQLLNFYHHWDTFRTSSRSKDRNRRRTVEHQKPYMRWADDGGPVLDQ